jgi:hypothetical protein
VPGSAAAFAHFTDSGIGSGLVATVGAIPVAVFSLAAVPAPKAVANATSGLLERIARPPRSAHSGHTGDYAAWLLVGAALFVAVSLAVLRRAVSNIATSRKPTAPARRSISRVLPWAGAPDGACVRCAIA